MVGLGVCRHMQGAEGKSQGAADIKIFFPLLKIKEHEADLACVGGVADGELETKMAVGDLVKIPLLDAPGESPDGSAVIGQNAFSGKARNGPPLFVQYGAFG